VPKESLPGAQAEALAQIGFSGRALEDVERIFELYAKNDRELALHHVEAIRDATLILAAHPLTGRVVAHGLRELVISCGRRRRW
jgi:plasmid stabilization system protein ParE